MSADILIADDEEDILRLTACRLRAKGYEVRTASNGRDAWESIRNHEPGLVILDFRMPLLDGYEVCVRMRGDERFRRTPVIFMTASSGNLRERLNEALGPVTLIPKPFEGATLVDAVRRLLQGEGKQEV